jgi:hypothetical protein
MVPAPSLPNLMEISLFFQWSGQHWTLVPLPRCELILSFFLYLLFFLQSWGLNSGLVLAGKVLYYFRHTPPLIFFFFCSLPSSLLPSLFLFLSLSLSLLPCLCLCLCVCPSIFVSLCFSLPLSLYVCLSLSLSFSVSL